ncbi:hypothetical protein [Saccharicrinis aurantiacus]|uniref:hypothetical protein n=1 Tax=Saccharicrinis aurantiacus TaxID=1849719 RepID=UPI0008397D0E|nr:hypothetical protein [Saccharicrinis aurantiacus]
MKTLAPLLIICLIAISISSCLCHKTYTKKGVRGNRSYTTTHTSRKYNKLKQQFLVSDELCKNNPLFDFPEKHLDISTFASLIELNDSARMDDSNFKKDKQDIPIVYEDDSLEITISKYQERPEIHIDIYNKKLFVTQTFKYQQNSLVYTSLGMYVGVSYHFENKSYKDYEDGSLRPLLNIDNSNYLKSFTVHTSNSRYYKSPADSIKEVQAGEAIKKEYPISWLEALELAKVYGGKMLTDDTRVRKSLQDEVFFFISKEEDRTSFKDYVDYISINAKTGELFHRHAKTRPDYELVEYDNENRSAFMRWLRPNKPKYEYE